MAMILDAFVGKFTEELSSYVKEKVIMVLGVKGELQKLQQQMLSIQSLLKDAEKRKLEESSVQNWLAQLKDFMYDADDIIDLCRIEGAQFLLLADQNHASKPSPVCCGLSSPFPYFRSVPLRHEIGNRVKELNDRLAQIYENRRMFKFERINTKQETQNSTLVNSRHTSCLVDEYVVGREVEESANELAELLLTEEVQQKCRLFAVTGMAGIGKTTLATKIFNHSKIQAEFQLKIWVCVSETFIDIELLQQVIRGAEGNSGNAATKSELQTILRDSVVSANSLFLVLDDVWKADVWVDLLRVPLQSTKTNVRILITTRKENVAREMNASRIHPVLKLSRERSWDVLRMRVFQDRQEEHVDSDLKQIGLQIVEKCEGLPLAIKAIAGVLAGKDRTRKEWEKVLRDDAWCTTELPEELRGALYLSFTDLPSHLKQCFLYCSLYPEDAELPRNELSRLWVAEGFVAERKDSLMEDLAEDYFNELVRRNLLIPNPGGDTSTMHDLFRSLALLLSKDESFCGEASVKTSSTTLTKIRRLGLADNKTAAEILDSVAEQGALRTLLASDANLTLNEETLRRLSHLRVLHIKSTPIKILPDSIGNLVHLRYLDLDRTNITAIPESIARLTNLQFLNICKCRNLTKLPNGITQLHNLRRLHLYNTPLIFIPKGIGKLQQLNELTGFVVSNDNLISSKLEELNSLKQIRMLSIRGLERAQSGAMILRELPQLSDLKLFFTKIDSKSERTRMEDQNTVEKLFDELIPPRSLEELEICDFSGRRFPNWMSSSTFEANTPFLTRLELMNITSCTQLPPLGQLPELKQLTITRVFGVKKIGEEFLGGGENAATLIAFPKLEILRIYVMPELEEWCFGERLEQNGATRFKLMPCLQKLIISGTPRLKQLPQGLKYTAMKKLTIWKAGSLRELGNLPSQIEYLRICFNPNLLKICHLPALRILHVMDCKALSCVERLDALHELSFHDAKMESLPEWLLNLLHNQTFYDFLLDMRCSDKSLRACLKGGSHWDIIQNIPRVIAYQAHGSGYFRYSKKPFIYDTNIVGDEACETTS
ncbi:putative disease resistance protein RGA1 [Platanthera zijinensis]|uniref:Disease resistance protein RGA1 n=1 Tax=Platanthera zijinensis TaxID=2320716 RepID=A0AAP0BB18_9ASPA